MATTAQSELQLATQTVSSLKWIPDISGEYRVIATFAGTNAYYGSSAETSFAVDEVAATQAPTEAPLQSMADQYLLPGIAAIIVVLAVGFAIIILMLRKRP